MNTVKIRVLALIAAGFSVVLFCLIVDLPILETKSRSNISQMLHSITVYGSNNNLRVAFKLKPSVLPSQVQLKLAELLNDPLFGQSEWPLNDASRTTEPLVTERQVYQMVLQQIEHQNMAKPKTVKSATN